MPLLLPILTDEETEAHGRSLAVPYRVTLESCVGSGFLICEHKDEIKFARGLLREWL